MVQSDFCRDISYNDPNVSYNEKMRCIFEEHDSFNNDQVENDIFNKTLDLHKKINEFNKIYACYVRKYYNTYNAPEYSLSPLGECEYIDNMSLNEALTYLEDKHSEIMALIEELKTHTVDLNTYGQFDQIPEFSQMQKTHTYIKETRNDLDNKLKELNAVDNSIAKQSKIEYDSTIYFSMVWTTLAACLIYYSFTEL